MFSPVEAFSFGEPVGTTNVERSGERHVTELSRLHRKVVRVRGTRGLDLDLFVYCNLCKKPYLFCEVKPYEVSEASWLMTRKLALYIGHGCMALLAVEPARPPEGMTIGFKFWDPVNGISALSWHTEKSAVETLDLLAESHRCW